MKTNCYAFVALMIVWIVLMGDFSPFTLISGILVCMACISFTHKWIPLNRINDVRFFKLFLHLLFLIKEIYVQGFYVIKIIFTSAKADIAVVDTELKSDFLKAILINSMTLTPGSIPLILDGNKLTVLNLGNPKAQNTYEEVNELRKNLEKNLIKAQK